MNLTWLGQVGLAVETGGRLVLVDPYLLDTLSASHGPQFNRLVPPDLSWAQKQPDMVLLTHDHGDHMDLPSLDAILSPERPVQILAGANAWKKAREHCKGPHNYILMKPGTQWTSENIRITAIPAFHSDESAVGFLIQAEGMTVAVSGDTLYNSTIFDAVTEPVDILFVVMNGKGNNMNCTDAARYAQKLQPKVTIPVHWGLFEKFSDDPHKFAAEAAKLDVKTYIAGIYETLDAAKLTEAEA